MVHLLILFDQPEAKEGEENMKYTEDKIKLIETTLYTYTYSDRTKWNWIIIDRWYKTPVLPKYDYYVIPSTRMEKYQLLSILLHIHVNLRPEIILDDEKQTYKSPCKVAETRMGWTPDNWDVIIYRNNIDREYYLKRIVEDLHRLGR